MMIDGYVLDTNSNQILDFDQRRFAETFFFRVLRMFRRKIGLKIE
jgi:hypothetical protein